MSENRDELAPVATGDEAAERLSFIQAVMGRTHEKTRGAAVIAGGLWFVLSLLATGTTWLLVTRGWAGEATGLAICGVWLGHNALGWAGTLIAMRRVPVISAAGRKIVELWAVATVAVWAVVASSVLADAIPAWTIFPMIQLVNGLVTAAGGLILRNGIWVAGGVALMALTPVVMGVLPPLWAYFGAGILIMLMYMTLGIVDGVLRGIRRAASQQ